MVGQKDRGMFVRVLCNLLRQSFVARPKIRNEGQCSDSHYEIGCDRRYAAGGVKSVQAGNRGGVTAVKMNDGAALSTFLVHCQMEEVFLAGFGAGDQTSVPIQLGEISRVELSQTR